MDWEQLTEEALAGARNRSFDVQQEFAARLVEHSEGRLEGFTITSKPGSPVETEFHQAKRNLTLARDMNPDQEAAAVRYAQKSGLPLPLVRSMDNREMGETPDFEATAPETLRFLGSDLSRAAIARDDVKPLNDAVETAQFAAMPPEERRSTLLESIRRDGYTPSQLADLAAAGMTPTSDAGVFSVDALKALNGKATYPVLESWYSGPEETALAERRKAERERWDKVFKRGFDNVRGSAWLAAATPETADSYIRRLDKEIVVMKGLYSLYDGEWTDFDDDALSKAVAETGAALGLDTKEISVARLRPAGVGWETEWEQVFDVLGLSTMQSTRMKLSPEELDAIHRNPENFGMGDKQELVDLLEQQAKALRTRTGWNKVLEGALYSIPFMIGFAATTTPAAATGLAQLAKGGIKNLPKFIAALAKHEWKRLPAYIPLIGVKAVEDAKPKITQIVKDGAVLPGLTERETGKLANFFFNRVLDTYIENFSEGLGGVIPAGKLLAPLRRAVPQKIRNAAFVQMAKHVLNNSKGAALTKQVYDRTMFHGLSGEYMEEKWGDAIRLVSTEFAQKLGTDFGDLRQETVFGTVDDEMQLMGSLLLTGSLMVTPRVPTLIGDLRRSSQFLDAHRALKGRVDASKTAKRSPETMETLLRNYTRLDDTAYLDPALARALFQSQPEVLNKMEIGDDVIAEAEKSERMIPVSMASLHTKLSADELNAVLMKLVPAARGGLTAEEAAKVDLSAEAERVATESDRERAERKAAYDEAQRQLMALGRPATEIRAFSKLLSMADYFGEHSGMTASEWISNVTFRMQSEADFLSKLTGGAEYQAAAALRRKGAPNTAGESGKLISGDVPHAEGFREWAGLSGTRLYADYEFLYGRHPQYFQSQEEARAAVELVLSKPERVEDINNNVSFAGIDEETGKIYRIEINPRVTRRENHIRSVFEITPDQYKKIKLENSPVLQPSPTEGQTVQKARSIANFLRYNINASDEKSSGGVKLDQQHRGATTFNDAWEATVTLFEGAADASTLIHETGHYAFEMMRHLVGIDSADGRMKEDFAKLEAWAQAGETDATGGKEKLARAFEAYCLEGKAPAVELEGAFATLRRLLLHIYKSVRALNVELSGEVRSVFDGMLASESTVNRDSILREVASMIDTELLGLSQPEIKTFRELIAKANEQSVAELAREKAAVLAERRTMWRKEANALMDGDRVYNAWRSIQREGGLDFAAMEEICGEWLALELRNRGLTTAPGRKSKPKIDPASGEVLRPAGYYSAKAGKHPATFAAANGFATVEAMADELYHSQSPAEFLASYMAEEERKFNREFEASEAALSTGATIEALEKLSELLAVKGGAQGYRIRRAELKRRARGEMELTRVGDILRDQKLIGDCRMNARKLTAAANEGDFGSALEEAGKLRFHLELLRQKAGARKEVEKVEKLLRKARHAKRGSIYGDHQRALQELSYRFGFTRTAPSLPGAATVQTVLDEYNLEAAENGDAPFHVPGWITGASQSYRDLAFTDLQDLAQVAEFLNGEGRDLVGAREHAFRESVKSAVEKCVAELEGRKHSFVKNGNAVAHGLRSMVQWGTKLRNILGRAGEWKADSEFQKLYDDMAFAGSEHYQLQTKPLRRVSAALQALHAGTAKLDLQGLPAFPEEVAAEAYRKWNAEMVIACCLNMGNAKNRQRLRDGFGWRESDLETIASRLGAPEWAQIQEIWDAIGSDELTHRVRRTFKEEYHFDLKEEEALPFDVTTADGQNPEMAGGYYPLDYLYHKNSVIEDKAHAAPAFRRAGFTYERQEKSSDPLRLSLDTVATHIYDACHYVSHRQTMRRVLRVVNDHAFKTHFQRTQGFERYDALKKLVENVAAPDAMREAAGRLESAGRAIVTASALWASPSVMAMQLASVTVGLDEVGSYYPDAAAECALHPVSSRAFVMERSGMMRDRVNLKDLDLRTRVNLFSEGKFHRGRQHLTEAGYWAMRELDMAVAVPAWMASYTKAMDGGKSESAAVAAADEFVAKTQGAARPIDLSPIQLSALGRGVTVFYSATSAAMTTASRTLSRIGTGELKGAPAVGAVMTNLFCPVFLAALIRYALAGDDDPEKARRAFLRELVTSPFSGIPLVRDVADYAAGRVIEKSGYARRDVFKHTALRGLSELAVSAFEAVDSLADENPDRALYKATDAVSMYLKVPVVKAYERAQRILANFGLDELPDWNKETKKTRNRY